MVTDLVGSRCDEVVACAYIRPDWPHKDPNELCMEATLLVVEDPAAAEEKEGKAALCVHASPAGLCPSAGVVHARLLCNVWCGGRARPPIRGLQRGAGNRS